jgi:multiple sugar transport system ATP-binding protein
MNGGRIEQIGAPLELYDRPVNRFVASFIGSPAMSFISGIYRHDGAGAAIEFGDGARLPVHAVEAADGTRVDVGIRPENYLLVENGPLPFETEVVETTGPETHVFGRIGAEEVRCVFRLRLDPAPGTVLRLAAEPEHIHLFDATTGMRLGPIVPVQ